MPSNFTKNYSLSQWERSDKVLMDDFNADNAKIDAALAAKADQTAVDNLAQTVSGHSSALACKGNCRIYSTTYNGTGLYGSDNPTVISFPQPPSIVFVTSGGGITATFIRGQSMAINGSAISITWSGNSIRFSSAISPGNQLNDRGAVYYAFALIPLG